MVKLEENFASTEAMDKKQDKPGQKIFEDHTFIKEGLNILRSAEVMNSLVFSDVCDRFTMIKSLFTALYC